MDIKELARQIKKRKLIIYKMLQNINIKAKILERKSFKGSKELAQKNKIA